MPARVVHKDLTQEESWARGAVWWNRDVEEAEGEPEKQHCQNMPTKLSV